MATESKHADSPVEEQVVNPWMVQSKTAIDYMKLIERFGCDPITPALLKRFEKVTRMRVHPWLRRGIFFSQKDLENILNEYEAGHTVYLYTGRGPSSEAMHLGHMIPFMFTKYLQDAFDAVLVIQLSDDEKYSFKGRSEGKRLEEYNRLSYENSRDIIACGFNPDKTFIFSNLKTVGGELYENTVKIMTTTGNQIKGIYGLTLDNTVGQLAWPAFQCAPAYSNSFSDILHPDGPYEVNKYDASKVYTGRHMFCLVPMAIDQDPYFRMARDFAARFKKDGFIKPATIHTKFLVALGGINAKMSSTGAAATDTTIYMTNDLKKIRKTIMKHAFSGGQDTLELHRKLGGDLDTDVAYQYLMYFEPDDDRLREIAHKYRSGKMTSGEIKEIMADVVCEVVRKHQEARDKLTDEDVCKFFTRDRKFDLKHSDRPPLELHTDSVYEGYGINFDPTFGAEPPMPAEEDSKVDTKLAEASALL